MSNEGDTIDEVVHKADLLFLSNGWNEKNERIIISIGENAASYKWMHEKCFSRHKQMYMIINILLIVISTGLSAETLFPQEETDFTFTLFRRIFTYIVTCLSILQNFLKSQELMGKHLMYANLFSELYHDIQQQMCMYRRDRIPATKYVADRLKQYDSLVVNGPDISRWVLKLFKNTFKNADIAIPDIADKIQKIEIITEPSIYPMTYEENHSERHSEHEKGSGLHTERLLNNLENIHNAFQIHGDISDKDIENASPEELKEIKNRIENKS